MWLESSRWVCLDGTYLEETGREACFRRRPRQRRPHYELGQDRDEVEPMIAGQRPGLLLRLDLADPVTLRRVALECRRLVEVLLGPLPVDPLGDLPLVAIMYRWKKRVQPAGEDWSWKAQSTISPRLWAHLPLKM